MTSFEYSFFLFVLPTLNLDYFDYVKKRANVSNSVLLDLLSAKLSPPLGASLNAHFQEFIFTSMRIPIPVREC